MNPAAAFSAFATQIATSKGASVLVVVMILLTLASIPQTSAIAPWLGVAIILTQLYGSKAN